MLVSEPLKAPRPRRRSHLGPMGWLLVAMVGGYVLVTFALYWLVSTGGGLFPVLFAIILAYDFVVYAIYFWILVYLVVEVGLWRRTRNPGHLLQSLGALLVLAPISWGLITSLSSNLFAAFSPAGLALVALEVASLASGLAMALYGYLHRGYHANDVDLYRNVVVRAGEKIGLLTDGYSTRVYETHYEGFPAEAVRARADEYATRFRRAGFFLFHRTDGTGITIYPIAYTGVGGFRLPTAFTHLYRLWRRPERLTWVRVEWTGDAHVHISPEDYARIKRPVAHHVLCAGVADAVVGSLLAYIHGQEAAAVEGLLGPDPARQPADLRLPGPHANRAGWLAVGLAVALLVAGTGTALSVGFAGPPQPQFSIQDVRWKPTNPVGGEPIYVYANLSGPNALVAFDTGFSLLIWAYFNDSTFGARSFNNIEGNLYGAWLGTYPNGTEVVFVVQGSAMVAGSDTVYAASPPYVVDVGTVHHGGSSGLSITGPSFSADALGGGLFGAWINSTAPIEAAQVLYSGYYSYSGSQGSGSGGLQVVAWNLTAAGSHYTLAVPSGVFGSATGDHVHLVVWYAFVARDTTWNTAATAFFTYEVNR